MLDSQGIVVKCTAAIFFPTVGSGKVRTEERARGEYFLSGQASPCALFHVTISYEFRLTYLVTSSSDHDCFTRSQHDVNVT